MRNEFLPDLGPIKPVEWIGSSRKDIRAFPDDVQDDLGYALFEAQIGLMPVGSKPLKGFGGAQVIETSVSSTDGTFRLVYTVRFAEAIYVLHAFQKKSKRGIKTPKSDLDLLHSRLLLAEELHAEKIREAQTGND